MFMIHSPGGLGFVPSQASGGRGGRAKGSQTAPPCRAGSRHAVLGARPSIAEEEKEFIFEDGPADCGSELILIQNLMGRLGRLHLEEIVGVQHRIAEKLERRAVKIVRSAFG